MAEAAILNSGDPEAAAMLRESETKSSRPIKRKSGFRFPKLRFSWLSVGSVPLIPNLLASSAGITAQDVFEEDLEDHLYREKWVAVTRVLCRGFSHLLIVLEQAELYEKGWPMLLEDVGTLIVAIKVEFTI